METGLAKKVEFMINQKRMLGILGACLAVGGGITWFFHHYLFSSILWAIAGVIVWKLNKMKKSSKKK
jgi:hypothetical protein